MSKSHLPCRGWAHTHTQSRAHTHPLEWWFLGCLDCRNAVKLISRSTRWLLNWWSCILQHQCECTWFCLCVSVCIIVFIACVHWPMSEFTARSSLLPEPTLHKLILILKGDFLLPPANSTLKASFWPFFLRATPSLLSPEPYGSFSSVTSFYFPCHPLIAAMSLPSSFAFLTFPVLSPLSFSCTRFSAHSLLVPRLLLWSPPSPAHFHTPSVCQQRFSSRVFTAPISPQWANLPQSTQQYSAVTLCVGWKHTHTHIHVHAPASGAYQSLALIGQYLLEPPHPQCAGHFTVMLLFGQYVYDMWIICCINLGGGGTLNSFPVGYWFVFLLRASEGKKPGAPTSTGSKG